jgi:hypothetical protein
MGLTAGTALNAEAPSLALPDEGTMMRLRAGEVVPEQETSRRSGASVSILVFIHAPVGRIWGIIISCGYARAFVAGLEFCQVLEERGDYALTRQIVNKGWMTPRLDYTFETVREPYRHMSFRLVRGNLKTLRGSWAVAAFPDGVLVRHVLVLQPLLPAPRWLVRRNLNKDLPDMLRCIRGLANGSGTPAALDADRQSCPGEVEPH